MFTESARQLIENAKRDAWTGGAEELGLAVLVAATARHPVGRVLLGRLAGLPAGRLAERFPGAPAGATLWTGRLRLSREVQAVLASALALAARVPDRVHPGLVDVRHLAAALALDAPCCRLLEADPRPEAEVVARLAALDEAQAQATPLGELSDGLRRLRGSLLAKVFGQDRAVNAFVEGLFCAEVVAQADEERRRPRALFVFAGPPGVGKTYLAELGAAALGRPYRRFDMSAFSDHQAHLSLVGFAPSFQGARPGLLTDFVERHPDAFLLFDEVEKAHASTVNLFLQVLDAGQLEDGFTSRDVPFRDTTVVFTTNAGATLYDRPNETGFAASSASFHRRTLLDALRSERGPGGQPLFPAAICSRMAAGHPLLFDALGVCELERVARTELERVGRLVEQQHFKAVAFDEALPLALVLAEGAGADARTVRARSALFVQAELFRLSELYRKGRLERVWQETDAIRFELDRAEPGGEGARLLDPEGRGKVLLVASPGLGALLARRVPEVEWVPAGSARDALQALAATEVDLVLLDLWLGRDPAAAALSGTLRHFDFAPPGASALAEGQACLRSLHERLPGLGVYLLSPVLSGQDGTVDEALLLASVRGGGARGVLATAFTSDATDGWEEARDRFAAALGGVLARMRREARARALGLERKALAFDTVPAVDLARRSITVRLRNLRLTRAVEAGDVGGLLSEVERPAVTLAHVFGADAAKEALSFLADWLRSPRRYAALGVRPPKGVLLTGPPGTGKTMLARALAGESDVAFLVASGTDFVTKWQGSGPENVRALFARARRYAPAVVFIDEVDAIGRRRTGGEGSARAEESTLNALLTEMDGFGGPTLRPVVVLAATNLAGELDEALRRRFDREVEVPPPDRAARAAFLRSELLGRSGSEVTQALVDELAGRSAGLTLAELRRVANEAAIAAARSGAPLADAVVGEAFERIRMGDPGAVPDAATLERIARHEAGHVVVCWLTGSLPVQATVVGRGGAGGYAEREEDEGRLLRTRAEILDLICQAMAGRAAEIVCYGEEDGLSTGVGSDLRAATRLAERMACDLGMSAELGHVQLDPRAAHGGALALRVTGAVERVVRSQLERARGLLSAHRDALDRVAAALLARNRLGRADLAALLGDPG